MVYFFANYKLSCTTVRLLKLAEDAKKRKDILAEKEAENAKKMAAEMARKAKEDKDRMLAQIKAQMIEARAEKESK